MYIYLYVNQYIIQSIRSQLRCAAFVECLCCLPFALSEASFLASMTVTCLHDHNGGLAHDYGIESGQQLRSVVFIV